MESEKLLTREMVNSPHHRSYVYNLQMADLESFIMEGKIFKLTNEAYLTLGLREQMPHPCWLYIRHCIIISSIKLSGPCGPMAVDILWMQIYFGFNHSSAETKSHCSVYHGCGYVCMNTWERSYRGLLHFHPGVRKTNEYQIAWKKNPSSVLLTSHQAYTKLIVIITSNQNFNKK
ncbi:hypothetical protein IGI04_015338 [Brassica rapa subsp. trilocularis]|uniref:Uncharacterized protein n=1 Tax=Brassica rapa subsp. trilocularis TaxID=1813537 RepID=A0ABQ7MSS1_BRACM|nr:hypothetical protein IGI04_015338 [Brassica rapa subsp. trilocularis]